LDADHLVVGRENVLGEKALLGVAMTVVVMVLAVFRLGLGRRFHYLKLKIHSSRAVANH
jgi:hypothetical protein